MNKKILIVGCNGMLGGSLLRFFTKRSEYEVKGTLRSNKSHLLKKQGFSNTVLIDKLFETSLLERLMLDFNPDYVFNCVGIIKQKTDSKKYLKTIEINSLLPHKIASVCEKFNAKLIHFSTDCVFSGKKGDYSEKDIPDASDLYGRSKLLGEVDYGNHITIRTSIIGHELERNLSLVDWFLAQENTVNGYSNAIFSGLPTCFLAEFIHNHIIDTNIKGLFHLSANSINKYDLLNKIKQIYDVKIKINKFKDFYVNRSLNSDLLKKKVGFESPSWNNLIEKMHSEYTEYFKQ